MRPLEPRSKGYLGLVPPSRRETWPLLGLRVLRWEMSERQGNFGWARHVEQGSSLWQPCWGVSCPCGLTEQLSFGEGKVELSLHISSGFYKNS